MSALRTYPYPFSHPRGALRSTARPPSKSGRGWLAPFSGERSAECLPGRDATPPSEAHPSLGGACLQALSARAAGAPGDGPACDPGRPAARGPPKLEVDTRTNRGKQWLRDTSERLQDAGWGATAGTPIQAKTCHRRSGGSLLWPWPVHVQTLNPCQALHKPSSPPPTPARAARRSGTPVTSPH